MPLDEWKISMYAQAEEKKMFLKRKK